MGFHRRSYYDLNRCEFQGRIVGEMKMIQVKKADKTIVDKILFKVVCNSNPFNIKSRYFVNMYAFGYMANAIMAKFKPNSKIFAIAEYKPSTKKAKTVAQQEELDYVFEIRHLVLEALPTEPENIQTLDAEDYEARDVIMQKEE